MIFEIVLANVSNMPVTGDIIPLKICVFVCLNAILGSIDIIRFTAAPILIVEN